MSARDEARQANAPPTVADFHRVMRLPRLHKGSRVYSKKTGLLGTIENGVVPGSNEKILRPDAAEPGEWVTPDDVIWP